MVYNVYNNDKHLGKFESAYTVICSYNLWHNRLSST